MKHKQRGFTLLELMIALAVIAIMGAIVAGNGRKYFAAANEQAAKDQIGTIQKATTQYWTQFGRYPENLLELGPPASGADSAKAANLIPKNLALGKKSGYVFTLIRTADGYQIHADPEKFGSSGYHTYYSDETMVIRRNETAEPATAQSPEI